MLNIHLQYTADWQALGDQDFDLADLINNLLETAHIERDIVSYNVLAVEKGGPFGLQYTSFQVVLSVPNEETLTFKKAKKYGENVINPILRDTDVKIRWINLT